MTGKLPPTLDDLWEQNLFVFPKISKLGHDCAYTHLTTEKLQKKSILKQLIMEILLKIALS